MKQQLRIKILKETTKAKEMRSFSLEKENKASYNTGIKQKEQDKKVEFLKGLCKLL